MSLLASIAELSTVAYFSMEVAVESAIPTYSGGLGVLAGDTLRASADLGLRMVGVTLLYRHGYFHQRLDDSGSQSEISNDWDPSCYFELMPAQAMVKIEGRTVAIQVWRYFVAGVRGDRIPVYFLDTAVASNSLWDQGLTDSLYGGDAYYRLCQEVVLGIGGVEILRALGYTDIHVYHMNEGHSALLTLALLEERLCERGATTLTDEDKAWVRQQCVFTTHTPVAAGHDRFSIQLVRQVLGDDRASLLELAGCSPDGILNMTEVALSLARHTNAVAMRHGEVSRSMFPNHPIDSITNGVHAATWVSAPFGRLYDRYLRGWRRHNFRLRNAVGIPLDEIRAAHAEAKQNLLAEVQRRTGVALDPDTLTIGFARRATGYKRPDLFFSDLDRLGQIGREAGNLQLIFAGKAHPRDDTGKDAIRRVFAAARALPAEIRVVYLEGYDLAMAQYLCAGVDLWLNNPQKPLEASGTSGMKAAMNGVPSFSVLDGWWVEGHVEGVTGWSIGDSANPESDPAVEIRSLYEKLNNVIVPLFYQQPDAFACVMRSTVALNGSFFHAERMVLQYLRDVYLSASMRGISEGALAAPD